MNWTHILSSISVRKANITDYDSVSCLSTSHDNLLGISGVAKIIDVCEAQFASPAIKGRTMAFEQRPNAAETSQLCGCCEQLDRSLALGMEDDSIPQTGIGMLSLGQRSRRTTCSLCRFLLDINTNYKKNYKQHVRMFARVEPYPSSIGLEALAALPRLRFFCVLREHSRLAYGSLVRDEIVKAGHLTYRPNIPLSVISLHIRTVNTMEVDFNFLRNVINDCQSMHSLCAREDLLQSLPYIYLINCIEGSVTRHHPSQEYLALSYV